jgi:hypothetical protein
MVSFHGLSVRFNVKTSLLLMHIKDRINDNRADVGSSFLTYEIFIHS